ncbi:MAG: LLM class flavin-dependent oxidoreductase, partial [Burkholderiales bacterium]
EQGVIGPTPHRPGGPPIWGGGSATEALARAGKHFDGWFPTGPDSNTFGGHWRQVQAAAREAGRDPQALDAAIYLTLAVDENAANAEERLNGFLSAYYGQRPDVLRKRQASFAGSMQAAVEWIQGYVNEGARHLVLRFAGDHQHNLDRFAKIRDSLRG